MSGSFSLIMHYVVQYSLKVSTLQDLCKIYLPFVYFVISHNAQNFVLNIFKSFSFCLSPLFELYLSEKSFKIVGIFYEFHFFFRGYSYTFPNSKFNVSIKTSWYELISRVFQIFQKTELYTDLFICLFILCQFLALKIFFLEILEILFIHIFLLS